MEEQPLISVIVPVYNIEAYLDACISSVLGQSWKNLELLLIDDGSTDGSGALCEKWAEKDKRVRVRHQANGGLSAARNAGLDMSRGAWISFVDGDDWLNETMLETLALLAIQNEGEIAACALNYQFPDGTECTGETGLISVLNRREALERLFDQREVRFEVCGKVYSRALVGESRFVPGQIYEDIRFTRMMVTRMNRYVYIDRPEYQYRQKRPGNTNSSFPAKKLEIIGECDEFAASLRGEGLEQAALGMEAFTLEHIIRMYVNAVDCGAEKEILIKLRAAYRTRFGACRENPYVRQTRGKIFAASPELYNWLSERLHSRS